MADGGRHQDTDIFLQHIYSVTVTENFPKFIICDSQRCTLRGWSCRFTLHLLSVTRSDLPAALLIINHPVCPVRLRQKMNLQFNQLLSH